jgi:hypothetical protein
MLQRRNRIFAPLRSAVLGKTFAIVMLSAVAACGDGSTAGASNGTQISAVTKAVPNANANANAQPGPPAQAAAGARRVTPFDPVANSMNPAMQKLARLQCIKRAKISPGVDKVPYAASSVQDLRQDNCAVIMGVDQG